MNIPLQTWVCLPWGPRAARLNQYEERPTITAYDKHVSAAPWAGAVYLTGGDYSGLSYRQTTYRVDCRVRLASDDPTAGWEIVYHHCGSADAGGTPRPERAGAPQPKGPDHVGWTYVPRIGKFVMLPGEMQPHWSPLCPGETTRWGVDDDGTALGGPRLLAFHVMAFDPVAREWDDWGTMPRTPERPQLIGTDSWSAVYDPRTDEIIKAVRGTWIAWYHVGRRTWRYSGLLSDQVGYDPKVAKSLWALDLEGRRIFMPDAIRGVLWCWRMDEERLVSLGSLPGGVVSTDSSRGYALWDPVARALLFARHAEPGTWLYYPDDDPPRWDAVQYPLLGAPPGALPQWRGGCYDPANNWFVGLGTAGLWLLRLTDSSSPLPPPSPGGRMPVTFDIPMTGSVSPAVLPTTVQARVEQVGGPIVRAEMVPYDPTTATLTIVIPLDAVAEKGNYNAYVDLLAGEVMLMTVGPVPFVVGSYAAPGPFVVRVGA